MSTIVQVNPHTGLDMLNDDMSTHEEANLILKLYELRREETMRKARDWYFREFQPETAEDVTRAFMGEHSGHFRMVTSYWDMAAALVNHGAISKDLFSATNGEYFGVFAKVEKLLEPVRAQYGPHFMAQLEKLIDATPGGRERSATVREMLKGMVERMKTQAKN